MLRRTKIIIALYGMSGIIVVVMAVGLVIQFLTPYELEEHHHHHAPEPTAPEATASETYVVGDRTFLKVPFMEEDFDVTDSCVDLSQIFQVNIDPEKFPDLEELRFISASETDLPEGDSVVGASIEGEDKAYPIRMLNYHVVLNDSCGGKEIAVVWDPLSLTAKVFRRKLEGSETSNGAATFGKLALLHNGGLLLYDEATRSIWSPPERKCLAGKLSGTLLSECPFLLVTWGDWKERHASTSVLSRDTPFKNRYYRNLYNRYYSMRELPMPVEGWDAEESPFGWSDPMIALEANGKAKAYPLSVLAKIETSAEDNFAGRKVVIHQTQSRLPYLTDEEGREILYSFGAWFLWSVRYPDIEVYSLESESQ